MSSISAGVDRPDYHQLKKELLRKGELFEDEEFPPNDASIGRKIKDVVWRRPGDILLHNHHLISRRTRHNRRGDGDGLLPLFIRHKATRADFDQGHLNDCWFIAAAACLTVANEHLFHNVIQPEGQTFDNNQYAGIFRFRFWRYGYWKDVIIDDLLPTVNGKLLFARNSEEQNEFWAPLMEKAYAKFNGSYSDLDFGFISEALIDMTGGITEIYMIQKSQKNLFDIMYKTIRSNCMMGSFINAERVMELANGLFTGRAYSITAVTEATTTDGKLHQIVRLRNPWGKNEWNGDWSDRSKLWMQLDREAKAEVDYKQLDDGEFWMSYKDWLRNFEYFEICYLSPEELTDPLALDPEKTTWNVTRYEDQWKIGVNAGGAQIAPQVAQEPLYWTNPQYRVEVSNKELDSDGRCDRVVSLLVVDNRKKQLFVALDVYKVKEGRTVAPGSQAEKDDLTLVADTVYEPVKEVTTRCNAEPGVYIIIPSTQRRHQEAEFLLRIFSEF